MSLSLATITIDELASITLAELFMLPINYQGQTLFGNPVGIYAAGATIATCWSQAGAAGIYAAAAQSAEVWTPANPNGIYSGGSD